MPINILVVDDSAMMRAMIRRALRLSGANVLVSEASNGREALAILESERIDAVFTDINMPVMSGHQSAEEPGVPIEDHIKRVVISTDGSAARRIEVRDLHVTHYISKPFAPEMFRDVICEVCPDSAAV